jgi:Ca2+-binding RTX toxin-like protein
VVRVAYIADIDPWSSWYQNSITGIATALDNNFGAGNWDYIDSYTLPDLTQYDFVYVDGSAENTSGLEGFLSNYRDELEAWVAQGNTLFINAARWGGTSPLDLGFGVSMFSGGSSRGFAVNPEYPIFDNDGADGDDTGLSWTGSSFAHDYLTGPATLRSLITNDAGQTVLADMQWGQGAVLFGGVTAEFFHSDNWGAWGPTTGHLLDNLFAYAAALSNAPLVADVASDFAGGSGYGVYKYSGGAYTGPSGSAVYDAAAVTALDGTVLALGGTAAAPGAITLSFSNAKVIDGPGYDLKIYDSVGGPEGFTLKASIDGVTWTDLGVFGTSGGTGYVSTTTTGIGYGTSYVTSIDLGAFGISEARYFRIGVADPVIFNYPQAYDLDALVAVNWYALSSNSAPNAPTDADTSGDSATATATISEFHAVGTAIGLTASGTDPDGDTVSYSFGLDTDGEPILETDKFAIDAVTGVVTLMAALDYESAPSHVLRIYATDPDGESSYTDFIVAVTDVIEGTPGEDALVGTPGKDEIHGYAGSDYILGHGGDDDIRGGEGHDYLGGGEGDDLLDGGAGWDRAAYSVDAANGVTVDLNIVGPQNTGRGLDSLVSIEHVSGTRFDDVITGDSGDNWLWGGSDGSGVTGNDTISGGAGNDLVQVGTGTHTLNGGDDTDTLSLHGNGTDITAAGVAVSLALQGAPQNTRQGMMTLTGFENLSGSVYNDELTGDDGDNILAGHDGDDILRGGAGNDTLYGDGAIGADTVLGRSGPITTGADLGGAGDDTLEGGLGDDVINGGGGSDTASYANAGGAVQIYLSAGVAEGADGNDALIGIENAVGSAYDDYVFGDDGDNILAGGDGHDSIRGYLGNDTLLGGDGDDLLYGYAGDDVMNGGAGWDRAGFSSGASAGVTVDLNVVGPQNTGQGLDTLTGIEHVSGTRFDDVITGDGGDNWLWGGSDGSGLTGNDTISGGGGNDLVQVGTGTHTLDGGSGSDTLSLHGNGTDITAVGVAVSLALQGAAQNTRQGMMTLTGFENLSGSVYNDELTGDGNDNVIAGEAGNDTLRGGAGNDTLYGDGSISADTHGIGTSGPILTIADDGAAGNDLLEGGHGNDVINGGAGTDTASYANASGGVAVDLAAGTAMGADGNDTLTAVENIIGSAHGDMLTGDGGVNALNGGGGNDTLTGGGGADNLTGGIGADTFRFTATSDSASGASDVIADFSGKHVLVLDSKGKLVKAAGQGDKLDLSAIDANTLVAGDQAFTLSSKFTGVAGQAYSSYDAATNRTSLFMDTDGDKVANATIVLLGNVNLQGSDFTL